MPTYRVPVDDHEIVIRASYWSGRESVFFDGVEVSRKSSWQFLTTHGFEVVEKSGRPVVFEVDVISGFRIGFALRRDGILIAASPRNTVPDNKFDAILDDRNWSAPSRAS